MIRFVVHHQEAALVTTQPDHIHHLLMAAAVHFLTLHRHQSVLLLQPGSLCGAASVYVVDEVTCTFKGKHNISKTAQDVDVDLKAALKKKKKVISAPACVVRLLSEQETVSICSSGDFDHTWIWIEVLGCSLVCLNLSTLVFIVFVCFLINQQERYVASRHLNLVHNLFVCALFHIVSIELHQAVVVLDPSFSSNTSRSYITHEQTRDI